MPFLPLKALGRYTNKEDDSTRRRTFRRVVLQAAEDLTPTPDNNVNTPFLQSRGFLESVGEKVRLEVPSLDASGAITPGCETPYGPKSASPSPRFVATPATTPFSKYLASAASTPKRTAPPVMVTPVRSKVKFAGSPEIQQCEVTPYAHVYGVHPAFFDFDRHGSMQPTQAGIREMQGGRLLGFTPSARGRMAFIVQGASPSGSSPSISPQKRLVRFPQSPAADCGFKLHEAVLVLTDDGKAWMDAVVIAVFPWDCEAEGYSIPAGTVKVSYELGIKWVMPSNISTTLRKKSVPGQIPQSPSLMSASPSPAQHWQQQQQAQAQGQQRQQPLFGQAMNAQQQQFVSQMPGKPAMHGTDQGVAPVLLGRQA